MATQLPPKRHSPQFSVHVCCGQTAGWIKMPLGREVGFGPGDVVLDGDPAPPRGTASNFRPMSVLLWPNGWMDQEPTWYGGRPRPRPHVTYGNPPPSTERGTAAPPSFRLMSIVAKRSPISATARHLSLVYLLLIYATLKTE